EDRKRQVGAQTRAVNAERAQNDDRNAKKLVVSLRQDLSRPFGRPIRAGWNAQWGVLPERDRGSLSVNGRGRDDQEAFDRMETGGLEDDERPADIGRLVHQWLIDAGADPGVGPQ